jgi:hypothetical protein
LGKKKTRPKARQFIREETPRKGRSGMAASPLEYTVHCTTAQGAGAEKPAISSVSDENAWIFRALR